MPGPVTEIIEMAIILWSEVAIFETQKVFMEKMLNNDGVLLRSWRNAF